MKEGLPRILFSCGSSGEVGQGAKTRSGQSLVVDMDDHNTGSANANARHLRHTIVRLIGAWVWLGVTKSEGRERRKISSKISEGSWAIGAGLVWHSSTAHTKSERSFWMRCRLAFAVSSFGSTPRKFMPSFDFVLRKARRMVENMSPCPVLRSSLDLDIESLGWRIMATVSNWFLMSLSNLSMENSSSRIRFVSFSWRSISVTVNGNKLENMLGSCSGRAITRTLNVWA